MIPALEWPWGYESWEITLGVLVVFVAVMLVILIVVAMRAVEWQRDNTVRYQAPTVRLDYQATYNRTKPIMTNLPPKLPPIHRQQYSDSQAKAYIKNRERS